MCRTHEYRMGLSDIIDRLSRTLDRRFIPNQRKHADLYVQATPLERQRYRQTRTDRERLDDIATRLKYRATTHKSEDLERAIRAIDTQRERYRTIGDTTILDLLTTKGTTYAKRFERIERHLETHEATYDDLALARAYLQNNSYLRRMRHDDGFVQRQERLEGLLDKKLARVARSDPGRRWYSPALRKARALFAHDPPKQKMEAERPYRLVGKRTAYLAKAAAVAGIVAGTLAAIPIPVYLALL